MIVEYTRYKIDEKQRTLFERVYEKAGEALSSSSHCLRYELSRCMENPDHYTLRIEWDSEEGHLKGFRNSPEFKSFFALVQPYVGEIEEMRHYKVISAARNLSRLLRLPKSTSLEADQWRQLDLRSTESQ